MALLLIIKTLSCSIMDATKRIFINQQLLLVLGLISLFGEVMASNRHGGDRLWFVPNEGQWQQDFYYRADMGGGYLFVQDSSLLFHWIDYGPIAKAHNGESTADLPKINGELVLPSHAYKVNFVGGNFTSKYSGAKRSTHVNNYFLGSDSNRWKSNVRSCEEVNRSEIYSGIDLKLYSVHGRFKYDFIVAPQADPNLINLGYEGHRGIAVNKQGELVVITSVGEVVEEVPVAYQDEDGLKVRIACKYKLVGNVLSFEFPNGYDTSKELIIDPVLTWSSYSGSKSTNFGCTATYDDDGNLYAGGTDFGTGYPVTTGAIQTTWGQGTIDMAISKFNASGTNLIYSTYIGGSDSEIPHSLVVNSANELYVLGISGSSNFPITTGAYDATFGGGEVLMIGGGYGFNYLTGCDMVVLKLNEAGTSLLGSSFVGGTGNDGINVGSDLHYNYGDAFRGEIIVDANDNVLVASCTQSIDFPVTANAAQATSGGRQDGCVFQMSGNLTNLDWATYAGGSDYDACYSVQVDANNNVFVTGGTMSSNFTVNGGFNTSFGGYIDGFVVKYDGAKALSASTFVGTAGYDQCYFVQTDNKGDVFVVGQTTGNYPMTAGVYGTANSGQFVQKLSNDLGSSILSTSIGRGSGAVDIAISAFLVSNCGQIYISGWGGVTNQDYLAKKSTTTGLPITADAYQSTTDGKDMYIMVLDEDASNLRYATFFGGPNSGEHVDGGTSRFDKKGVMYQAVCAGCSYNNDFPTTAGVWSQTNGERCNLGVFKFDLGSIESVVSSGTPIICIPDPVQFQSSSQGENVYEWDFGDGGTSTEVNPSHSYTDTGTFVVTVIVSDSLGCLIPDTVQLIVDVLINDSIQVVHPDTICPGDQVQLSASGADTYEWSPSTGLSQTDISNPLASPPQTITYKVVGKDQCGKDSLNVILVVDFQDVNVSDTLVCLGNSVPLTIDGNGQAEWEANPSLSGTTGSTVVASPDSTTSYFVKITSRFGCEFRDSVTVEVDSIFPDPVISSNDSICRNSSIRLVASGASNYHWRPAASLSADAGASVMASPSQTTTYIVAFSTVCDTVYDSVTIFVEPPFGVVGPDPTVCPGDSGLLYASGGVSYSWSPEDLTSRFDDSTVYAFPVSAPFDYTVFVTNARGCVDTLKSTVFHYPLPRIYAKEYYSVFPYDPVQLLAQGDPGVFSWFPTDYLSCSDCSDPIVSTEFDMLYTVTLTDTNGCKNSTQVKVEQQSTLYVPNTFTPNGGTDNEFFFAKSYNIGDFEMHIFDRWGKVVFETKSKESKWDGTYKGEIAPIGTYVWRIRYSNHSGEYNTIVGHVNLVR